MPITEDATYNEQVILTVRGANLYGSHYGVYHVDGGESIEYTPLSGYPDELEYILQSNGRYDIVVNGYVYKSIFIEAGEERRFNVVAVRTRQKVGINYGLNDTVNEVVTFGEYQNYPYLYLASHPYYYVSITMEGEQAVISKDIELINATSAKTQYYNGALRLFLLPIDRERPMIVLVGGYIVFVGNYVN